MKRQLFCYVVRSTWQRLGEDASFRFHSLPLSFPLLQVLIVALLSRRIVGSAVDRAYGASNTGRAEDPFLSSAGIWADMTDEDVAALEALRGPGLGERLARE